MSFPSFPQLIRSTSCVTAFTLVAFSAAAQVGVPIEIDDPTLANSATPEIAIDALGNAVAVWDQFNGFEARIFSAFYDAASQQWSTPEQIDDPNLLFSRRPHIAMTPLGQAIAVWQQFDGSRIHVLASVFSRANRTWSNPARLDPPDMGNATAPRVAVSFFAVAIAVWQQNNGPDNSIMASRYDPLRRTWSDAVAIENPNLGFALFPEVAVDFLGRAIAVWFQFDTTLLRNVIQASRFSRGDGWSQVVQLDDSTLGDAQQPRISMDWLGNGTAGWLQFDPNQTRFTIQTNRFHRRNGWQSPDNIDDPALGNAFFPEVALPPLRGPATTVFFQFNGSRTVILANQYDAPSDTWGAASSIDDPELGTALTPQVGVDRRGNATAVWLQSTIDGRMNMVLKNEYSVTTGLWGEPTIINDPNVGRSFAPQITLNLDNDAIAVWQQFNGLRNAIYAVKIR